MGDGALDTEEGQALASEIVGMLEAELVRFQHRVAHDHGIELDRARAAMVLLGRLIGDGVKWTAKTDSDPSRIYELFTSMLPKHPQIAPTLKKEIAAFFVATTDVKVVEDAATTPSAMLRRAGADPSLWWWAADYDDPTRCWAACAGDVDRSIQLALAFGTPVDRIGHALATALGSLASRVKTKFARQRADLTTALETLAAGTHDAATITKFAFEMRFKDPQGADPLAELSIHAFHLAEALQAAKATPDVERFGALAGRADRMFATRGLQLATTVRADLESAVAEAIALIPA